MRCFWLAALVLSCVGSAPPAVASPVHRIVAVGDLHGDFAAWRGIARAARLVNARGHWIGGDTVLVQTGDVVDRGPDSLKIIQDLMRLQPEALRDHGQVIALVGNHEAMNMTGDLRYVSSQDYAAYTDKNSVQRRENLYAANQATIALAYRRADPQMTDDAVKQAWLAANPLGSIEHQMAWDPEGKIGRWVAGNPAIALLDGTLFVHGGISPGYAHMTIAEINQKVSDALKAKTTDPLSIINDPLGPLWYRGLATPNAEAADGAPAGTAAAIAPTEPPVEDQLNDLLSAYDAKRIVIAHTPILSGIAILYGGRLIRIDTGITSVYGGAVSYLDIMDGTPVAHAIARPRLSAKERAR
jgi:hypothetical protein